MKTTIVLVLLILTCVTGWNQNDCPFVFSPACATNGITYDNTCKLIRSGAEFSHRGYCRGSDSISAVPALKVSNNPSTKIVNGFPIDITKIPYQATLRRRVKSTWVHFCGAIIIANNVILTAAHCVDTYVNHPSSIKVVVGTSHRLTGGKSYEISRIIVHEQYSTSTLENDIAVVGISEILTFSSSVKSIAIASSTLSLPAGTETLVSGFGTTSVNGNVSSILLGAIVKIVDQEVCARAYMGIATIYSGMLCASEIEPLRDSCQGDSGGPLVADNVLVGIVSWGKGCAHEAYPGVYTRVSEYNSWIVHNMALL